MINVTKTYLPNKKKYLNYINQIYSNGWITNKGPLVNLLEKKLAKFLGVKHIVLVSNGTVALELAYKALELKGEVITTPFSFVATTSSIAANNLKPIFADIDKKTFNIDTKQIEKKISAKTSAIVPVHVFGNSCEIDKIKNIAKKHNLKVVYDACHAFDVNYKNQNILNYGDISTLSFHATKTFHTIEGGALIINDDKLVEKVRYLINFGIKNKEEIVALGTNGKMNEFEAAMGLCLLDDLNILYEKRKKVYNLYYKNLKNHFLFQKQNKNSTKNFSYFPIVFESNEKLKKIEKALNKENIFPRRYFYPSLDTLKYIKPKQKSPISRDIASRILCLPFYADLELDIQQKIIKIIKENLK